LRGTHDDDVGRLELGNLHADSQRRYEARNIGRANRLLGVDDVVTRNINGADKRKVNGAVVSDAHVHFGGFGKRVDAAEASK